MDLKLKGLKVVVAGGSKSIGKSVVKFMADEGCVVHDYLRLVEYATKAPSGHNTQPWLFKLKEDCIEIHPNFVQHLAVVDKTNRELFISLGCATENLCIAASTMAYQTSVSVNKEGIITIELKKSTQVLPDPLCEQITKRQTNKQVYENKRIPKYILDMLDTVALENGITRYVYDKDSPTFEQLKTYILRANAMQMSDPAFKKELLNAMRFNKVQDESKRDGLSYRTLGAPSLPSFIAKPIVKSFLKPSRQNKSDEKKIESSPNLVLFTTQDNTLAEWVALGRSLERFLLKTTELGIANAYMNQPNEIECIASEMQNSLPINHAYPTIILRLGYANPVPFSMRKKIEDVIIKD